jgi:N-acetylmuramic acid 6-phosphate (MurNAc-6-P) etherase
MLSIEDSTAGLYLDKSNGNIKLAVIMYKYEVELEKAKEILSDNNNSLIGIIE